MKVLSVQRRNAGRAGVTSTAEVPRTARLLMWVVLALLAFLPPLLSEPGRYISDTRDPVWFSTNAYVTHSLQLWQPSPFLGNEQHDGLLFPMATFVAAVRGIGVPLWATERLWHGLLLFVAAAGMVLLVEHLLGRRSVVAPLTAALVFTFTPFTFGYGLPHSGTYLAYALLPLLLLATAKGLATSHRVAAGAAFGLVTFAMGGANGAPQLYALIVVGAFVLWEVAVARSIRAPAALRFLGWAALFSLGLNAYWFFLLRSPEVGNALAYTEQPQTIGGGSTFAESARGMGFWGFYGPWTPVVHRFVTNPLFVLTSWLVPIGAVVSAWLVRWRYRLLFVFLFALSVVVMVGVFPFSHPTPYGRVLTFLYDHVRAAAGLRTSYKFGSALELSLAVLVGVGAEALVLRMRRVPWRGLAVAGIAVVLLANAWPLWTGGMYAGNRPVKGIPSYWRAALADVQTRDRGYRAYFTPGSLKPFYSWGELNGVADLSNLSSVTWSPLPVGRGYGSNLLSAIEEPYQYGLPAVHTADLLRYLGVRDLLVENDIDWRDSVTARPATLHTLVRNPSLQSVRSYGKPGENAFVGNKSQFDPLGRLERTLPPVQMLTVPGARPIVRAETGPPIVVSGDGFGLSSMARAGMLSAQPPILYSGALTATDLRRALRQHASFVITDSNRRRYWLFSEALGRHSQTLPADQALPLNRTFGLFGNRPDTQTTATYDGVRSITASGYGSPFELQPQYRPLNAFDRNPGTSWLTGTLGDPVGAWVEVSFGSDRTLSRVSLLTPSQSVGRRVRSVRLGFSDGTSIDANVNPGRTTVSFPPHRTASLRVTITDVQPGIANTPVGFQEILIPHLRVQEIIRAPDDVLRLAQATKTSLAGAPLAFLFERARTRVSGGDEEVGITRQFESPVDRSFALSGTVRINPKAPDDAIDRLVGATGNAVATSSSRFFNEPALRASAAIDGDRATAWAPQTGVGAWLRVGFPRRRLGNLTVSTDTRPGHRRITSIRVDFSDGSSVSAARPFLGVFNLHFRSRLVSAVKITVESLRPTTGFRAPPGITEVAIRGVRVHAPDPSATVACQDRAGFTLDHQPIPVRPDGTVGQILAGGEIPLLPCSPSGIHVGRGVHVLEFGGVGALEPNIVELQSRTTTPSRQAAPRLRVTSKNGVPATIRVERATKPFYLAIGQSWTPAWKASVDGASLGTPLILDGYSAGWFVTKTGTYTISIHYGPQRVYSMLLAVSALFLLLAVAVLVTVRRQRRRS